MVRRTPGEPGGYRNGIAAPVSVSVARGRAVQGASCTGGAGLTASGEGLGTVGIMRTPISSRLGILLASLTVVAGIGFAGPVGASSGGTTTTAPTKVTLPPATPIASLRNKTVTLNLKGTSSLVLPSLRGGASYVVLSAPSGIVTYGTVKVNGSEHPMIFAIKVGRASVTLYSPAGGLPIKFTVVVTSKAPKITTSLGTLYHSLASLNKVTAHLKLGSNSAILLAALPGHTQYVLRSSAPKVVTYGETTISGKLIPLVAALTVGRATVTLINPTTRKSATFTVIVSK